MIIALLLADSLTPHDAFQWSALGWLLGGITALCVCANQIDEYFQRRKDKPSLPPNEQLQSSHQSLSVRVDRVEGDVSGIRTEMKADRAASVLDGSARSKTIFQQMEKLREEMKSDLDKQTTRLEARSDKQMASLETRIEGMPEKLINLLRHTGAIGKRSHD